MNDLFIGMAVNILLQVVETSPANSKWRRAFLKVFRAIAMKYKNDSEFQQATLDTFTGAMKK